MWVPRASGGLSRGTCLRRTRTLAPRGSWTRQTGSGNTPVVSPWDSGSLAQSLHWVRRRRLLGEGRASSPQGRALGPSATCAQWKISKPKALVAMASGAVLSSHREPMVRNTKAARLLPSQLPTHLLPLPQEGLLEFWEMARSTQAMNTGGRTRGTECHHDVTVPVVLA